MPLCLESHINALFCEFLVYFTMPNILESKSIQKGCDSPLSYPLPFHRSANSAAEVAICFSFFIIMFLSAKLQKKSDNTKELMGKHVMELKNE